ncbi:MAG: class C sortase [Bilifractor sp.]|jgi:sortase A
MKPSSGKKKHSKIQTICIIGFLICVCLLAYPTIADRWNKYRDSKLITRYIDKVDRDVTQEEQEKEFADAQAYNADLAKVTTALITEDEYKREDRYEKLLNPEQDGMMGYLEIPCIDVKEPIYHYANDETLEKGIGHIHGTSLPVGGKNTHAVITGHRGIPGKKMLTDLNKVGEGDRFYLHILGKTLAYQVYDIHTVKPNEVEDLNLEAGRDIVTIITCTPYGVNTDRMLVTGERIPFDESVVKDGEVSTEKKKSYPDPSFYALMGVLLFLVMFFILTRVVRKRRERKQAEAGKGRSP